MTANEPSQLLRLQGVWREFAAGDTSVAALRSVDVSIASGEFVAIVGVSGSGKSTLMNILGCLDRPTRGSYFVAGRDTAALDPDALAALRREHFGFIFQRYQLLPHLTALANVEVPAVYAGRPRNSRRTRAAQLLSRLGLADRATHKPNELSGGQQQRVSIARALMNGGEILLADEPTGALDSHSGAEVMNILREMHADGHTVVIVTHDMNVAENADRIIEISDGMIVADRRKVDRRVQKSRASASLFSPGLAARADQLREAFSIALLAMRAQRLRTALTMLGIIIGIAAVISVVAIGEGSRRKVLAGISYLGTSTIEIWAGAGWGDTRAARTAQLRPEDVEALAEQPYIAAATPIVEATVVARYRGHSARAEVTGANEQYFRAKGIRMAEGVAYTADSVKRYSQDVVIDQKTRKSFFPQSNPLGQVILLGAVPVRIVGVATDSPTISGGNTLRIFAPYTTVRSRLAGEETNIRSVVLKVADNVSTGAAEAAAVRLLSLRRGTSGFYIENSDAVRKTVDATAQTMTLLISAIAVISLLVGGIGVMNILLVSVTERTSEIGVRVAVGARRSDILAQFLIEAVLVCLFGGVLGVALALGGGLLFSSLTSDFPMVFSKTSILVAFICSTAIGLIFGYLPARNAARLDPVVALARA